MNTPTVPDFVKPNLEALGCDIPAAVLGQLARYLDLLLKANEYMNLTGVRELEAAWKILIIDSLTLLGGLEDASKDSRLIDVGSGGGLPGIPLAICRNDIQVTLLESTGKKVRFLQDCIKTLGLTNVRAIQDRAEVLGQDSAHRGQYDVAVSRAVGPMTLVLEYCLPLVKVGGRVLAMKGPKVEAELREAGDALALLGAGDLQVFDAYPESFDNQLVILSIIKDRITPPPYPRAPGTARRSPL